MITLDGSYLEGGGALVRTALALSTLTGKEFHVDKIRANRPQPGLKAQHLTAIKALEEICKAETKGATIGSTELWYKPGKITKGTYNIDIGTAGSITLMLQGVLLPCLFAPGKVTLNVTGGTCGAWQASVDYLQNVLLPQVQRFVDKIELKILRRGYYPKGGGQVKLEISPRFSLKDYESFDAFHDDIKAKTSKISLLDQGKLEQIRGVVNVSEELQSKQVGERIQLAAESYLKGCGVPVNIRVEYAKAFSTGGELLLWALCSKGGRMDYDNPVILGGDALLDKRKSSEMVAKEAAEELNVAINSDAAVDAHLADQLIPFMGLLPGSGVRTNQVTKHAQTNMYVVEKFLPIGFKVEKETIYAEEVA